MRPQNIFGEALLLFVLAILLMIRDRGSATSSTNYDSLLGGILLVLAFVRLTEFVGGCQDAHLFARFIVWLMWFIPLIIFIWITVNYNRLDTAVMIAVTIAIIIGVTLMLISGAGGFDILPPDFSVGTSNGIYQWIRTDGAFAFLPLVFYVILTVALIYLTAIAARDSTYWFLALITALGFGIGAVAVPDLIVKSPLATLGSLSTLVMLVVGFVAYSMAPG